jgi:aminoglycoside 6'-N-acetyltransferase I
MREALWPGEPELASEIDAFLQGGEVQATDLSAVFVSETVSGQRTGFLELFVRNYAEGCVGPTPYVEGWYVEPAVRGSGVGRALVGAAEEWARQHGFSELASDTQLENEASQRAHEALGFEEVERIVHFRKAL